MLWSRNLIKGKDDESPTSTINFRSDKMNIKELAIKHGLSQHLQLEKTSITDKLEAFAQAVIEAFVSEQKCEPVGVFNREIDNAHGAFRYEVHQGEPLKFGDNLYTTPQPREWVGLSDEDKFNLFECHADDVVEHGQGC